MEAQQEKRGWFRFLDAEQHKSIYTKIRDMEYECTLMVKYLSNLGRKVDDSTLEELSKLSVFVNKMDTNYYNDNDVDLDENKLEEKYKEAMKIHNKLSILSQPANAVSIRYTEFRRGFFLKNNLVVNTLLVLTILFLVGYILLKVLGNPMSEVRNSAIIFCASGLGAGFYTLLTVRRYLVNRSYNPRYNPSYMIRFFLGIAAGSILAFILSDTLDKGSAPGTENLSLEVLAVVGGFAADAVGIILSRIAEILIAAFRGIRRDDESGREILEKEKEIAKKETKNEVIGAITKIQSKAYKANASQEILDAIEKGIEEVEKK